MCDPDSDSLSQLNSLDCWDYSIELEYLQGSEDLQLAAELGKTLLERNKELEGSLRQKQTIIDDQKQEIEYLTKQTAALREVSDSRLRIYEQLEVSIQDLERQNHRLVLDNSSSKKHIKTLTASIENLEGKCEELQTTIDELRLQIDVFKRRSSRISDQQAQNPSSNTVNLRHIDKNSDNETDIFSETEQTPQLQDDNCEESTISQKTETPQQITADNDGEEIIDENVEQISQLMAQLRECKTQSSRDQRRITELEEQLSTLIQQNQALENQVIQLHHSHEDEKSMYDELSTLEEVRKGQMCSRCLRNIDKSDELLEDDDSSMLEELMTTSQHRASFTMNIQESTPNTSTPGKQETGHLYKDLVEKYEALLEVHRQPVRNNQKHKDVSLHEELQMSGDFNPSIKDTDDESGNGDSLKPEKPHTITKTTTNNNNNNKTTHQAVSHTPTDFSETETSSSGFSDETYNKSTQTEDRGSFLWTIADGDDCKFSIYDDTSPVTSRFKNRPEYQQLFKEIFTVLKNTTEKPEVEKDEQIADSQINNPAEFINQYDEDSQSIVSSTMSELSLTQNEPTTIIENIIQSQNQPIPEPEILTTIDGTMTTTTIATTTATITTTATKDERVLRPLVRQPLEYLSVEVRKRSSSRRKHKYQQDRSDSPVTHIIGSPKICYTNRPASGRRRGRTDSSTSPQLPPPKQNAQEIDNTWNGSTLQFWSTNRNLTSSPTPSQGSGKVCFEFRPSSASQDLHKLKKLDLSYAQVLRNADNKKKHKQNRK